MRSRQPSKIHKLAFRAAAGAAGAVCGGENAVTCCMPLAERRFLKPDGKSILSSRDIAGIVSINDKARKNEEIRMGDRPGCVFYDQRFFAQPIRPALAVSRGRSLSCRANTPVRLGPRHLFLLVWRKIRDCSTAVGMTERTLTLDKALRGGD